MPFVYQAIPAVDFTTSATPGLETDALFVKPGTRNLSVLALYAVGKGAGLTAISGIVQRLKKFTATASAIGGGGVTISPLPSRDPGAQPSKSSAGYNTGASGVTSGSGGPVLQLVVGHGAAGPGAWVAPNADAMPTLEGSATMSLDVFNSSNTASLKCEVELDIVE